MAKSLFEKLVSQEIPSWIVWEDNTHIAFLTPFPNTPGVTIVCPKENPGGYIFEVDDKEYLALVSAAKKVAKGLKSALGVERVALIFEGTGVDHIHAKLYPMHGDLAGQTNVWPHHKEFYPEYIGYLSTVEGPKMPDSELDKLQNTIKKALS